MKEKTLIASYISQVSFNCERNPAHIGLNKIGNILDYITEKAIAVWSGFRHGCVQVLRYCPTGPAFLLGGLYVQDPQELQAYILPTSSPTPRGYILRVRSGVLNKNSILLFLNGLGWVMGPPLIQSVWPGTFNIGREPLCLLYLFLSLCGTE